MEDQTVRQQGHRYFHHLYCLQGCWLKWADWTCHVVAQCGEQTESGAPGRSVGFPDVPEDQHSVEPCLGRVGVNGLQELQLLYGSLLEDPVGMTYVPGHNEAGRIACLLQVCCFLPQQHTVTDMPAAAG